MMLKSHSGVYPGGVDESINVFKFFSTDIHLVVAALGFTDFASGNYMIAYCSLP